MKSGKSSQSLSSKFIDLRMRRGFWWMFLGQGISLSLRQIRHLQEICLSIIKFHSPEGACMRLSILYLLLLFQIEILSHWADTSVILTGHSLTWLTCEGHRQSILFRLIFSKFSLLLDSLMILFFLGILIFKLNYTPILLSWKLFLLISVSLYYTDGIDHIFYRCDSQKAILYLIYLKRTFHDFLSFPKHEHFSSYES